MALAATRMTVLHYSPILGLVPGCLRMQLLAGFPPSQYPGSGGSMRHRSWLAGAVCAAALLVVETQPLQGQRVSIAPNIGVYIPTTELVKAASGQEFKQEVSITLGGRLGIFFTERLGLEVTGTYAPSDLKMTQSGFGDQQQDANVFTGSGRLSYQ